MSAGLLGERGTVSPADYCTITGRKPEACKFHQALDNFPGLTADTQKLPDSPKRHLPVTLSAAFPS